MYIQGMVLPFADGNKKLDEMNKLVCPSETTVNKDDLQFGIDDGLNIVWNLLSCKMHIQRLIRGMKEGRDSDILVMRIVLVFVKF